MSLDDVGLMALIFGTVRADHMCEGILDEYIREGTMIKWLQRLKELDQFRMKFESVEVKDDIITFETLGVYRAKETTPLQSMNLSIRVLNPDFAVPELPTGLAVTP
jgi:hypothetical protein